MATTPNILNIFGSPCLEDIALSGMGAARPIVWLRHCMRFTSTVLGKGESGVELSAKYVAELLYPSSAKAMLLAR